MRKTILGLALVCQMSYAGTAFWTGNVKVEGNGPWPVALWCEYYYQGTYFQKRFEIKYNFGTCPAQVETGD
jgi:hypothetical protein